MLNGFPKDAQRYLSHVFAHFLMSEGASSDGNYMVEGTHVPERSPCLLQISQIHNDRRVALAFGTSASVSPYDMEAFIKERVYGCGSETTCCTGYKYALH